MPTDFRDPPKTPALALTLIALGVVAACLMAGYIAVGIWNRAQEDRDPNRVTGFERPG